MADPIPVDSMIETAPEPGRRERKKQATRDELMTHAARLFAERGFDAVTTSDIAEAADVSQRTFFRHFESKEAVLYGRSDEMWTEIEAAFRARPAGESVIDSVVAALSVIGQAYEADPDMTYLQARLAAGYPAVAAYARAVVQTRWERGLTALISERMGVDSSIDPRPEIIAGATFSAFRAAIRRWSTEQGRRPFADLLDESLDGLSRLAG